MVLGRKDVVAEADWLFNQPTDVAFGKNAEIYVSDGYGNSRVAKFDRDGKFLKSWGTTGPDTASSISRTAWLWTKGATSMSAIAKTDASRSSMPTEISEGIDQHRLHLWPVHHT